MEAELLNWALCRGICDNPKSATPCFGHSLSVAAFPEAGGGLAAARDLKEGELILAVPEDALLNVDSFKEDKPLNEALVRFSYLSPFQVLAALLLREVGQGSSSIWFTYLKTLPQCYHTFVRFSDFEIQALQAEDAIGTAEHVVHTAEKEWNETKPFLQSLGLKSRLTTWRAWQWAYSTISSRTLHVSWSSAGTLCPVGDLFNYAPPENDTKVVNKENDNQCHLSDVHVESVTLLQQTQSRNLQEVSEQDSFEAGGKHCFTDRLTDGGYDMNSCSYCFYAREDYRKGDQVLLCYGSYTNLELLEHYGFILNNNPIDRVFIRLDSFSCFKTNLLPDMFKSDKPSSMHIEVDGTPSFQLLASLRLCCASKEARHRHGHLAMCGQQISYENDLRVYHCLRETCSGLLEKFPSTMLIDSSLRHILSLCGSYTGLLCLLDHIGNPSLPSVVLNKVLQDSVCDWKDLSASEQAQVISELQRFSQHCSCSAWRASVKEQSLQMELWWLSITWRFHQKRILSKCIAHCSNQIMLLEMKKIP